MRHWKPEYLLAFADERCPQKLFGMAVDMAQDLGMEYLGLNIRIQIATQTPHLFMYSNYPREWIERYQRDDLYKQDSAANASHVSTMPVLWTDDLYREAPQFRKAACQSGLRHGWTQSLHDRQHNESQITVARSRRSISIAELYEKAGSVQWLCHTLHEVISAHHLTALCPPQPKLSERELEVLKWSAAGKTAVDCAQIMSLSHSTVNFHIRSVITKTNAANKAAAIAIAVMRGWI